MSDDCRVCGDYLACPDHPTPGCERVIAFIREHAPRIPSVIGWYLDGAEGKSGSWRFRGWYAGDAGCRCPLGLVPGAPSEAPANDLAAASGEYGDLTEDELGCFIEWWDDLPQTSWAIKDAVATVWTRPLP